MIIHVVYVFVEYRAPVTYGVPGAVAPAPLSPSTYGVPGAVAPAPLSPATYSAPVAVSSPNSGGFAISSSVGGYTSTSTTDESSGK